MEAFAGIVLLVIAMFVYAGFTAVTEKLDEIIERLTPPRHVHAPVPGRTARAAPLPDFTTCFDACGPEHAPPCALPASRHMSLTSTRLPA
jgi:hypothetical protein